MLDFELAASSPAEPGGSSSTPKSSSVARTSSKSRPLADLIVGVGAGAETRGESAVSVSGLAHDSREVRDGFLFFCVPGLTTDGHDFAAAAVANGASVLIVERFLDLEVPAQVRVPSVREAMGSISADFFGRPADHMQVVGITGTNGKTTTTYLLEAVFRAAGMKPGVIGTTGVRIDGAVYPAPHTTPEAPDLHGLFADMLEAGVQAVAMEVSSHGLVQHRAGGVRFACAVFTNLSQDHLDYHDTLEEYFAAKAMLFTPAMSDHAAVNADNAEGRRLLDTGVPTLTFGLADDADMRATAVEVTSRGISFDLGPGMHVASRLRGSYNVENCLAAATAARWLGIPDEAVVAGLESVTGVPGRLEPVDEGQPFAVLVDYAHTPDSVENVLRAARGLTDGKVIAVVGCGGDRDRTKRPKMGRAATSLADFTVITSDNPRSEDPASIIAQIEPGAVEGGGAFEVESDRRVAIRIALQAASAGDAVVIAGKGHETGQEFADRTIAFDDRVVAAEELRDLAEGGA